MPVFRLEGDEVGGEFDFAILQVRGIAEIDDAPVVRVGHWDREVNVPGDSLVCSRVPERLAIQNVDAGSDVDANHPCVERQNHQKKNQKRKG